MAPPIAIGVGLGVRFQPPAAAGDPPLSIGGQPIGLLLALTYAGAAGGTAGQPIGLLLSLTKAS